MTTTKPLNEEKPREWYLNRGSFSWIVSETPNSLFPGKYSICVIERFALDETLKRISALEAENAKLREALKWYADADHWEKTKPLTYDRINVSDIEIRDFGYLANIGGKRARLALKECEGGNAD